MTATMLVAATALTTIALANSASAGTTLGTSAAERGRYFGAAIAAPKYRPFSAAEAPSVLAASAA